MNFFTKLFLYMHKWIVRKKPKLFAFVHKNKVSLVVITPLFVLSYISDPNHLFIYKETLHEIILKTITYHIKSRAVLSSTKENVTCLSVSVCGYGKRVLAGQSQDER